MKWCIIFAVAVIGDIVTTSYLLSQGGIELNQLMVLPMSVFIPLKIMSIVVVVWWYKRTESSFVPIVAGGATSGAVLYNLIGVLSL